MNKTEINKNKFGNRMEIPKIKNNNTNQNKKQFNNRKPDNKKFDNKKHIQKNDNFKKPTSKENNVVVKEKKDIFKENKFQYLTSSFQRKIKNEFVEYVAVNKSFLKTEKRLIKILFKLSDCITKELSVMSQSDQMKAIKNDYEYKKALVDCVNKKVDDLKNTWYVSIEGVEIDEKTKTSSNKFIIWLLDTLNKEFRKFC